jgi:hypothetical protein
MVVDSSGRGTGEHPLQSHPLRGVKRFRQLFLSIHHFGRLHNFGLPSVAGLIRSAAKAIAFPCDAGGQSLFFSGYTT